MSLHRLSIELSRCRGSGQIVPNRPRIDYVVKSWTLNEISTRHYRFVGL